MGFPCFTDWNCASETDSVGQEVNKMISLHTWLTCFAWMTRMEL